MNTLKDLYFHTFGENGSIHWQGRIVRELSNDRCLVQVFSWITGEPTVMFLVNVSEMVDSERWQFYEDAGAMNWEYEHVLAPRQTLLEGERDSVESIDGVTGNCEHGIDWHNSCAQCDPEND